MTLHTGYCDAHYIGRSNSGAIKLSGGIVILRDVFRIAYILFAPSTVFGCDLDHIINTAEHVKHWLGAYGALVQVLQLCCGICEQILQLQEPLAA